jgi:hypothetical protein
MIKKALIAFVFTIAGMQAQTIKPDTLLGNWNLRKISLMGNLADLKTGDIEVSDEYAREKGQTKEALAEQFKKRLPGMKGTLMFYTGNRMEYQIGAREPVIGSYILTSENGKQFIEDRFSGSRIQLYFKDSLLYWEVLGNEGLIIMAWEKQDE